MTLWWSKNYKMMHYDAKVLRISLYEVSINLWCDLTTLAHIRVTIGHLRATMGHLRLTIGHPRATIGYLKAVSLSRIINLCLLHIWSKLLNS